MTAIGCAAAPERVRLVPTPTMPTPSRAPSPMPSPPVDAKTPAITPGATPSSTAAPTPSPSATPEESGAQPPLLERAAKKLDLALEDLTCDQLVLAAASGTSCRIYAYERDADGLFVKAMSARGHVGKNGVSKSKREGDLCTPQGCFALGFAFGLGKNPNQDYPFRAITEESYWVDDPSSAHYNQWVEGAEGKDWNSAERLWRAKTAYALAVAVEYNWGKDAVPGKGSAIFLHVGEEATSGCIAMSKEDLAALVRWLDADASPRILIVNEP